MATQSALAAAQDIGAKSLGYPALGAGVGRFPLKRAAEVMVAAVLGAESSGSVERVVFVVRDSAAMVEFEAAISHPR